MPGAFVSAITCVLPASGRHYQAYLHAGQRPALRQAASYVP
ncbi:Hypothetical protein EPM1_3928 [Stenotrophomonas maltophilia EPM1]|nr:Hypothetical protein EPM1_3928 [Stenotrophomonas maltophilia EPM1]